MIVAAEPHLLSPDELWTLAGAVTAVLVITNGLHYAFQLSQKVVGLVFSLLIAAGAAAASDGQSWQTWVTVIPNGFMIYTSAVGVSSMSGASVRRLERPSKTEELMPAARRFWSPWYGW